MWLWLALMFGIFYGVITAVSTYMGKGGAPSSIFMGFFLMGCLYLIRPSMVSLMMSVTWVSEKEEPVRNH